MGNSFSCLDTAVEPEKTSIGIGFCIEKGFRLNLINVTVVLSPRKLILFTGDVIVAQNINLLY